MYFIFRTPFQNNKAKIDDAEQKHYVVQQTSDTISMRLRSLEQLQDQNYMRPLNDTGLQHCLVLQRLNHFTAAL